MDVISRQVVRPHRGRRWACLQMNVDDDIALTHVDSFTRVADSAISAHGDAVDRDIDTIRFKGGRGGSQSRQDPAPIRIFSVDGALKQIAPRNSPSGLESLALTRRFVHGDGNVLGGSFGVRDQLLRKVDT